MTNSGGLILVCRWAGANPLVQNIFRFTIHLLTQHLLAQSYWWKNQWMCEIYWKLTIKTPERCHWRRSDVFTVNSKLLTSCSSVFSVSIIDFKQVKSRLGNKSHRSDKPKMLSCSEKKFRKSFSVRKKRFIYCSQTRTQNLWQSFF